jgi:succinyl-diaminopimelate desuccinylase
MGPVQLDLDDDVVALAAALINVPSESRAEADLADAVERSLTARAHLQVSRHGNTVVARTNLGRSERVVIAGHLDTVPANGNMPATLVDDVLAGLGAVDMKSNVAVALRLAAHVENPARDVTFIFYDCEEIEAAENGLGKLAATNPEFLSADLAVVMEPSNAVVEAGCQGTLRAEIRTTGVRAHTARAWQGTNAIHALTGALNALAAYVPRHAIVDGLEYIEGLQAIAVDGGVAGNVVPDAAVLTVNHRFAPDRTIEAATAHVQEVFSGYDVVIVDAAPAARPGLDRPAAADFLRVTGGVPQPKLGWTDVARFAAADTPALNFGAGDPLLAHTAGEHVAVEEVRRVEAVMAAWLSAAIASS